MDKIYIPLWGQKLRYFNAGKYTDHFRMNVASICFYLLCFQVNELMLLLDNALSEVINIESRLDEYDLMVGNIASQMGQMKNQESFIQITNKNHGRLLEELDKLVVGICT